MADETVRQESPYKLPFPNGLPPGTDSWEQFEEKPRHPRPAAVATRPTPEWPPVEERKGKWIEKYIEQLDPRTEYDQIIRTVMLFGSGDFFVSIGYVAVFSMLCQTPSGSLAVHTGGLSYKRGHQRFYEVQLAFFYYALHGSNAPETIQHIKGVNKIHGTVWKRVPGAFSSPWEGQMSFIADSYFETWVRKVVGAKKQDPHPILQQAWPEWCERTCGHFQTEPRDGSRSMALNYPRNWKETEDFFYWFDNMPFDEISTEEQRQTGHRVAETFVNQFCELWFPGPLKFLGRAVILTFIPPNTRRRQHLGDPSPILSAIVKFVIKLLMDYQDAYGSDPAEPPMLALRKAQRKSNLFKIDEQIRQKRSSETRTAITFGAFIVLAGSIFIFMGQKAKAHFN